MIDDDSDVNDYQVIYGILFFLSIVESKEIASMSYRKFLSERVFQQWRVIGCMSKVLQIGTQQIERLKPKLVTNGAMFTFTIAVDHVEFDNVRNGLLHAIENHQLREVLCICSCFVGFLLQEEQLVLIYHIDNIFNYSNLKQL